MPKNAVEWHTTIATDFDAGYNRSDNFKERYGIFSELIKKFSHSKHHVIDLGCGSGVFSLLAASLNQKVTGIDGSERMIDIGKKKAEANNVKNIEFVIANITDLTSKDAPPADLMICSSVLEYIDGMGKAIDGMEKLLNPNGTLIVSMPNKSSLYRKLEKLSFALFKNPKYYKFVKNVLTMKEMSTQLEERNFKIIEAHYFSNAPIFSKLLSHHSFKKWTKNLYVIIAQKNAL